jgi:hypothetical protein
VKRFLRNLLILDGLIAIGVGVGGAIAGWDATRFGYVLLFVCALGFLLGGAAFGGTGPGSGVHSSGGMGGLAASQMANAAAHGEEVMAAYQSDARTKKGDFYGRWRARRGWNEGSPRVAWLLIVTGVLAGVAAFLVSNIYE